MRKYFIQQQYLWFVFIAHKSYNFHINRHELTSMKISNICAKKLKKKAKKKSKLCKMWNKFQSDVFKWTIELILKGIQVKKITNLILQYEINIYRTTNYWTDCFWVEKTAKTCVRS